jgi:hypothetical protein
MVPHLFNSQSFNRYSYCRNNPLIYIDPTGHWDSEGVSSGGFGGHGIGNPGSYGGEQYVGAAGFGDGYGSDNDSNSSAIAESRTRTVDTYALPNFSDIKGAIGTVIGNVPGDIFTIGGSYGHMLNVGVLGSPVPLGIAGSFDRVIMGDGKADWFFTFGAGISCRGFSIQADRGKIGKANAALGNEYNLIKSDVGGWTFSFNSESLIAGVEVAHNILNPTEVVTVKAGPRISALKPGVNIMVNYTFDLPFKLENR